MEDRKSGAIYRITSKNTTEYVKPKKRTRKGAIPNSIKAEGKTYQVTSIAANAFKGNKKLRTVVIGRNVETIGRRAFYKCTSLKQIKIPKKTARIGKQAFYGCRNLKTITLQTKKLKASKIGSGAWKGISKKAVVKVPGAKLKKYKKILRAKGLPKTAVMKK